MGHLITVFTQKPNRKTTLKLQQTRALALAINGIFVSYQPVLLSILLYIFMWYRMYNIGLDTWLGLVSFLSMLQLHKVSH